MKLEKLTKGKKFNNGMRYKLTFNNSHTQFFTEKAFAELQREITTLQTADNKSLKPSCENCGSLEHKFCILA